jgi:hypothetical protein
MSENIKQFELNTEKFAGPMDLLLSLIEDKKNGDYRSKFGSSN